MFKSDLMANSFFCFKKTNVHRKKICRSIAKMICKFVHFTVQYPTSHHPNRGLKQAFRGPKLCAVLDYVQNEIISKNIYQFFTVLKLKCDPQDSMRP